MPKEKISKAHAELLADDAVPFRGALLIEWPGGFPETDEPIDWDADQRETIPEAIKLSDVRWVK